MLNPFNYLRWFYSILRRARSDLDFTIMRQYWWAHGVSIASTAMLRMDDRSVLDMGEGTVIGPYSILDLQTDSRLGGNVKSELIIGRRTAVNEFNNIRASNGSISIGDDCLISQFVTIIAVNHGTAPGAPIKDQAHNLARRDVQIGNDVWLGASCAVLPGVRIGDGAIIGAGSVVLDNIPDNVIAAGIPAVVKKRR